MHDIQTLAELLRTDQSDVLGMVERGALPVPTLIDGRLVRWAGETVDRWIASGCPFTKPPRQTFFSRVRLEWQAERLDRSLRIAAAREEMAGQAPDEEKNER